jgi:EAL and modified HD-GYP domain-containing signal transduction protein
MTQQTTTSTEPVSVSVARRAVFDQKRRLWGYELFCVGNSGESLAGIPDDRDVPVSVAASTGVGLQQIIARDKRVFVSLTEKNIVDEEVYALPPSSTIVLVSEQTNAKPGVAARLEQLKADDFPVAVPVFTGAAECENLYAMADIIGVTVQDHSRDELAAAVAAVQNHGARPMACLVSDVERFTVCRDLGFELFQGPFSKEPEIVRLRKVSSNQIVRFNLLKMISTEAPDMRELVDKIQSDAAISFRLLTYLNSAAFGFSHRVKSIPHAISMLGWRQMRSWLRVVLLSDVNQDADGSELLRIAAQRAKFLELLAQRYSFWGFDPESMHLLGLFSLLDAMTGVPMAEIVTFLPLDSGMKAALSGEANSEYLPLITLARDLEDARWTEAQDAIRRLNLDNVGVRAAFQESVAWAEELTSTIVSV